MPTFHRTADLARQEELRKRLREAMCTDVEEQRELIVARANGQTEAVFWERAPSTPLQAARALLCQARALCADAATRRLLLREAIDQVRYDRLRRRCQSAC